MNRYTCCLTEIGDRIEYTATGPRGTFTERGQRGEFAFLRKLARLRAGIDE